MLAVSFIIVYRIYKTIINIKHVMNFLMHVELALSKAAQNEKQTLRCILLMAHYFQVDSIFSLGSA